MKQSYFIFIFSLISATIIFISCQQEITEFIQNEPSCSIIRGDYYGGGGMHDSVTFTYNSDKLTRAEGNDEYVLYYYTGNNISIRKFYEKPGDVFFAVDSIQYDNANRIKRISSWEYPTMPGYDTTNAIYDLIYQGTTLTKVIETDIIPNYYTEIANYLFTTNAAGNIEWIHIADEMNTVYDSIFYSYNTDPNYFKLVHPHFFLFDPFFELHVGLVPHFPYFYSHNNVSQFRIYGTAVYSIVYGLDSLNNVTSVDLDGFEYMKYKFSCQTP